MKSALLTILSSCFLIISFPAFDYGFLAWVALIPLFIAIKGKRPKTAFLLSFLTGIVLLNGVVYWLYYIKGFTLIDSLLLGGYLALYYGSFGFLLNTTSRRPGLLRLLAAPAIWVSMEYLRSNAGFLADPWALLGHTQYRYLPVIQIASLTGVYGISFLLVMVNMFLADMILVATPGDKSPGPSIRSLLLKTGVLPVVCIGVTVSYGVWVLNQKHDAEKVTLTVVQANIAQKIKWDPKFLKVNIEKHVTLTKDASEQNHAQLIVWPEATFPIFQRYDLFFSRIIHRLLVLTRSHLLVGSSERPKLAGKEFRGKNTYNSVYFYSPAGAVLDRYDKIRLLPFGEYLPAESLIPWPSRLESIAGNSIPGKRYTIFSLNDSRFGVLICWESLFPDLARAFVNRGAQFLVNMSNEAWFGETAAPYQFLSMNVFRAVENRVAIARAVNTGISCFISPFGEVTGRVRRGNKDIFIEGYATQAIPLSFNKTFYTMYGDVFSYLNLLVVFLLLVISLLRRDGKQ